MRAAVALWGVLLLLAGCQRPFAPGPPETIIYLKSLDVVDVTPESTRPVTLESALLTETIEAQLAQAGLTVVAKGEPSPEQWSEFVESRRKAGQRKPGTVWPVRLKLSVVYGLQSPDGVASTVIAAPGKLALRGEVAIRFPGGSESVREALEANAGGEVAADRSAYSVALKTWLGQASQKMGKRIAQKVRVYALPADKLISTLSATEVNERLDAAERLAMLRHVPAVEALAKRLSAESERTVRFRIVGALAEIGDDGATRALIGAADPRDREMLRAIVDALSVIGGPRVAEFFGIMSMHDAIEVRELVQSALKRLEKRAIRAPRRGQDQETP